MIEHQSAVGAVKKRLSSRDLALVASFAALIAVLGLPAGITVFGNAVPITLQTLGVMLAGSILGWKRGSLSVIVLLVLVGAGLPLLSGGRGGLAVFFGPSAGYLFGWVFGAEAPAGIPAVVGRPGQCAGWYRCRLSGRGPGPGCGDRHISVGCSRGIVGFPSRRCDQSGHRHCRGLCRPSWLPGDHCRQWSHQRARR